MSEDRQLHDITGRSLTRALERRALPGLKDRDFSTLCRAMLGVPMSDIHGILI
jgi:hypothetical protein